MFAANEGVTPNDKLYVDDVFSTYLYTGNGSSQTITNGIDLAGKGGMVWTKRRSGAAMDHGIQDTVRGINNVLESNTTDAQLTAAAISSVSSTGFTVGNSSYTNTNGEAYVSWTFRKQPKFFDVVTWTGNNANPRVISHNLGSVPGAMFIKATSVTTNNAWYVYHTSFDGSLRLNTTAAGVGGQPWYRNGFTSTTISVSDTINATGVTYVAYLFAHDPSEDGIIQCGSYTGNGSSVDVNLGWEPQYLLIKTASVADDWFVFDRMRSMTVNTQGAAALFPNKSNSETAGYTLKPTATGFNTGDFKTNGVTYIYLAIRRPNKPPTTGTQVYNVVAFTGNNATSTRTAGFALDLSITKSRSPGWVSAYSDRLRGFGNLLWTGDAYGADAEVATTRHSADNTSYTTVGGYNYDNQSSTPFINHFFRRAPGFMDVVCYTGNGTTSRDVTHNLGVIPEFFIVKNRGLLTNWNVYLVGTGAGFKLELNTDIAKTGLGNYWGGVAPTATTFHLGSSNANVNGSGYNYVAYLFASCPGVSKVGSYTGTGTSQTINCGFTTGARFILIKRTDSTGDWYIWDSARGIVAANDPHLSLNTTATEVTTNDSVDPDSSGFIVNQNTATNINVSGASYIFLAIA